MNVSGSRGMNASIARVMVSALAVFACLLLFSGMARAAVSITAVTLNGGSSVSVSPDASITAAVNATVTGTGGQARWRATKWTIGATTTCFNHENYDSAGSYGTSFSVTAPSTVGTYNASFIAYTNDNCSSGASATVTLTNGVTVVGNPVPTLTSLSPSSQSAGGSAFTLTVTGTNFVSGAVVRFNGSDRTTTYVSATQLTASIPATDLTTVGSYPVTVFNPAPVGGTSNAVNFTVSTGPPGAVVSAASNVTFAAARFNGSVSSNGADTTVSFEYGLSTAYGYSVAATPASVSAGSSNVAVYADLDGLNCNTLFYYRVKATNSAGTSYSAAQTFTTSACSSPYPATACAATRYNGDLGCTAADVRLTEITLAPGSISSCVSGTPVTLDLDLTVNFSSPDRWDVGVFIANDGKSPTLLPANGGAGSCSVDVLPITTPASGFTFPSLDGAPATTDTCGDGNSSINGGTGSGVKRMSGVSLPCYASAASGGKLFVPFVVTWDNQKSPIGKLCTSNLHPVPSTAAKCNAPSATVAINIVVMPTISKSNGVATLNPGANTTYTVTITNNSGGTLQDSVFTDPAVANLTVNSISCTPAGGAICPTATVAAMQGSGIAIPSANLPNNGSLTFSIGATVSAGATIGSFITNTATIAIGSLSHSATDTDQVTLSPAATKSFAPSSITESNTSVMSIALSNPTGSAVTGVAFTDIYPSGLVNASTPGATTTCGGTVTAVSNGNSLALSGGSIAANSNCTVTVNVTSATSGSYTNSTGTISASSGDIASASATLTVEAPVFGGFNACEVATAPNSSCTNLTTASTSRIKTKVAGTPFSLAIVALNTNGTRRTNYSNNITVSLLDASDDSGALDSYNCRSSWTTIGSPLTVSSPFSSGLAQSVGSFTVADAYHDVRVKVVNSGGSTRIGCSTDSFAIRPNSLQIVASDTDWQTAGLTRTLTNTDATTASPTHKAGQPFTLTVTGLNASGVTTSRYPGSGVVTSSNPAFSMSACAGTACTGSFGGLSSGTATEAAGTITWSGATYSEVGAFTLSMQDTEFAVTDAVDTSADCTSTGRYVCGNVSVGRFVPDHFQTAVTAPMNCGSLVFSPACPTGDYMAYSGQGFTVAVSAHAASGGITTLYAGALDKGVSLTAWDGLGSSVLQNPPASGGTLGTGSLAFVAGEASDTRTYTFSASPEAPTTIHLRAIDGDGVSSLKAVPANSVEGGLKIISGRLVVENMYGPTNARLAVNVRQMYYDGSKWLTNTMGSSLGTASTAFSLGDTSTCTSGNSYCGVLLGTSTITGSAGVYRLLLSPPTSGSDRQSVIVNSAIPYLSGSGKQSWGTFRSPFLYQRER